MVKSPIFLLIFIVCSIATNKGFAMEKTTQEAFSFTEIKPYMRALTQEPSYIYSFDNIKLAYYKFASEQSSRDSIIFYHGSGIYSASFYHHMAQELAKLGITTYLFDIRGHGKSQGLRGDSPTPEHVWKDVDSAIEFVKKENPQSSVYLGGHSSGAGLALNYAQWKKNPPVDGYLLLAPYLGHDSETVRDDQKFIPRVRVWIYIAQAITGFKFLYNMPTLYFNYPEWLKKDDSDILPYYTCGMSMATAPMNAKDIIAQLKQPVALFDGEKDEQFYPEKVVAFKNYIQESLSHNSVACIIPGANHLSIVLEAPQLFAEFIAKNPKAST